MDDPPQPRPDDHQNLHAHTSNRDGQNSRDFSFGDDPTPGSAKNRNSSGTLSLKSFLTVAVMLGLSYAGLTGASVSHNNDSLWCSERSPVPRDRNVYVHCPTVDRIPLDSGKNARWLRSRTLQQA